MSVYREPQETSPEEPAGWALVPGGGGFVAVEELRPSVRFYQPPPFDPHFDAIRYMRPSDFATEIVEAKGHLYRLPSIGWDGVLYVADEDAVRIGTLLRAAEGVVLFVVWLRFEQERQKPIRCRCGELRQAHAKGWRFGTCEDGEPHWQCPECVKQDAEPEAR